MSLLWLAVLCFSSVLLTCQSQSVDHPSSTDTIPFIIDIRHSNSHQCAGALVQVNADKDAIVLTHSSCAPISIAKDVLTIYGGNTENNANSGLWQVRRVAKVYRFGPDLIGLVPHMPFRKSKTVRAFLLPAPWEVIPTNALMESLGWDRVGPSPDSAFVAFIIRRSNVPLEYLHTCLHTYKNQKLGHDDVFCLRRIPSQKKCQADKGGVARIMKSEKIYGVFRYSENCKKNDNPFVYVRISNFVNVITSSVATYSMAHAADYADAPYHVNLFYMNAISGKSGHCCSGALVTHREMQMVLTTDHCMPDWKKTDKIVLFAGRVKIYGKEPFSQAVTIKRAYKKPNGLALLFTDPKFYYSEAVRPIELPIDRQPVKEWDHMVTSGYYRTKPGANFTNLVIKTNQPVINPGKCKREYEDFEFDRDDFFCVNGDEKDDVPCDMDGGAVAVKWPHIGGNPVLMGLQQFNLACSDKSYPYVFKSVPFYYNWINNAIDDYLNNPN